MIRTRIRKKTIFLVVLIFSAAIAPEPDSVRAEVIWVGDYETGDFMQWPDSDGDTPNLSGMPIYCRPVGPTSYYGDGSCLSIETTIVRNGRYAAKVTVKNSEDGAGEPEDCGGVPDCDRRRVELKSYEALDSATVTVLPYMAERWISISHFVPSNWDDSGSGWGPIVFQIKPYINNSAVSPVFEIGLNDGSWEIQHRWSDVVHLAAQLPWQQQMFYNASYPALNGSDSGADMLADYPNATNSRAALASVNKGGWTDWVIHVRWDARGASSGGTGFLEVFKKEDNGAWVEVLDIRPRRIDRGDMTFDRGIGYNEPARSTYRSVGDHGGYWFLAGMYLERGQVWNLPSSRVIYNDNIKVGDTNSNLTEMQPEGVAIVRPEPPSNLTTSQ